MSSRGRLHQRKWYYAILTIVGILVAFSLFSRRELHLRPSIPWSVDVGRQAFDRAYQRVSVSSSATTSSNDSTSLAPSPSPPAYFEPGVYDPLGLNPAPLVELAVKACLWPPSLWDVCTIDSTAREDAIKGPWVRVDRDLDRRTGVYYNYLFYRRRQAYSALPPVTGIELLTEDEARDSTIGDRLLREGWTMAENDLRAGVWPRQPRLDLWYRTEPAPTSEPFTELDVLYGNAGLRDGWEKIGMVTNSSDKTAVWVAGRRKPKTPPAKPQLRFSPSGRFRVLQLADFHFSTEQGECRDTINATACPGFEGNDPDLASIEFLNRAIDQVQPDLVVLSGDQINGQSTSWNAFSAIMKVSRVFANRTIPWAAVFGNHDEETTDATKIEQMKLMQTLPYFVGEAGPPSVDGVGNYVLRLQSADPTHATLFTIFLFDSHAYANTLFTSAYDYIKESQITWFKAEAANTSMLLRPYLPPSLEAEEGMFGISSSNPASHPAVAGRRQRGERRRARAVAERQATQLLRKPNAMAFWHIPLPEADDPIDIDPVSKAPLSIGEAIETSGGGPKHNSHLFDALLDATDAGFRSTISAHAGQGLSLQDALEAAAKAPPEVKIIAHGHQHLRASCERRKGIWMCWAGGSSYSGYGRTNFDRRVRVFEITEYGEKVETWQLVDSSSSDAPPPAPTSTSLPGLPEGGIGGSEADAKEADLQEEILEELEAEGWIPVPDQEAGNEGLGQAPSVGERAARSRERRQRPGVIMLKEVNRAILVGPGALGS